MFMKILIGLTAFFVIAGTAPAMDWQPSWAPDPIPLVQGQEYRTGSPLSQPGLMGLFGGLANGLTGGALPEFTRGGSIIWRGETATCAGIEVNGQCLRALSTNQAQTLQDAIDWSTVANADRVAVPGANGWACNKSRAEPMQMAIKLYDQGITSFDCDGNPIEHASAGDCPAGQRLWVTMVEDDALGARNVYTCR